MLGTCVALGLMAGTAQPTRADETDQFTLPLDPPFADVGDYINFVHYQALQRVVDRTNRRIDRALRITDPVGRKAALEPLQGPQVLADGVRDEFGQGWVNTRGLEAALASDRARRLFPNHLTSYKTPFWIYFYTHLPFDPRKIVLLMQSSTIKVYTVYLGTDKMGHFHDLGHLYYKDYIHYRRRGISHAEAVRKVLDIYVYGPISEGGMIGIFATGVYSNADLAANYCGMKFYRNLTEPEMFKGRECPPMIVRDGERWKLNSHVRPDYPFFETFVSDHFNEALNPSLHEWGMRWAIRGRLRDQAENIVKFYADEHGQPRSREWFEDKAYTLATYYGEPYGHSGRWEQIVAIHNACWDPVSYQSDPTPPRP